jgi:hypothetical protein
MDHRRDPQLTGILNADKAAIEQVIDARRQQQPILPVETLIVRRVSP